MPFGFTLRQLRTFQGEPERLTRIRGRIEPARIVLIWENKVKRNAAADGITETFYP